MKVLHDRDETKENFIKKKMEEEPKDGHMNPLKSLSIIQDSLPKDSILVFHCYNIYHTYFLKIGYFKIWYYLLSN